MGALYHLHIQALLVLCATLMGSVNCLWEAPPGIMFPTVEQQAQQLQAQQQVDPADIQARGFFHLCGHWYCAPVVSQSLSQAVRDAAQKGGSALASLLNLNRNQRSEDQLFLQENQRQSAGAQPVQAMEAPSPAMTPPRFPAQHQKDSPQYKLIPYKNLEGPGPEWSAHLRNRDPFNFVGNIPDRFPYTY